MAGAARAGERWSTAAAPCRPKPTRPGAAATRLWLRAGDSERAAEARGRRIETNPAPRPRAFAWLPPAAVPAVNIEQPEAGHPDREVLRRLLRRPRLPRGGPRRSSAISCKAVRSAPGRSSRPASPPPSSGRQLRRGLRPRPQKLASGGLHKLARELAREPSEAAGPLQRSCSPTRRSRAWSRSTAPGATPASPSASCCSQRSRDLALDDPERARKAVDLAVQVAEQLDLDLYGAPVVQDLRAIAWAYLAESRRVQAEVRLAESAMGKAERLLEDGTGDPWRRAELLAPPGLPRGLLAAGSRRRIRLLNRAASIYRRLGEPPPPRPHAAQEGHPARQLGPARRRDPAPDPPQHRPRRPPARAAPDRLRHPQPDLVPERGRRNGRQLGEAAACLGRRAPPLRARRGPPPPRPPALAGGQARRPPARRRGSRCSPPARSSPAKGSPTRRRSPPWTSPSSTSGRTAGPTCAARPTRSSRSSARTTCTARPWPPCSPSSRGAARTSPRG